jgi:hypothetical protein
MRRGKNALKRGRGPHDWIPRARRPRTLDPKRAIPIRTYRKVFDSSANHPRVHGCPCEILAWKFPLHESSPRARVPQVRPELGQILRRTIPACTGAPEGEKLACLRTSNHPRVHGCPPVPADLGVLPAESSPRARVPRRANMAQSILRRIIPACTGYCSPGEPRARARGILQRWPRDRSLAANHPRVHGLCSR